MTKDQTTAILLPVAQRRYAPVPVAVLDIRLTDDHLGIVAELRLGERGRQYLACRLNPSPESRGTQLTQREYDIMTGGR